MFRFLPYPLLESGFLPGMHVRVLHRIPEPAVLIPEYFLSADGDLDLDYIVDLEDRMRSYGIVVPLTFNDVRQVCS